MTERFALSRFDELTQHLHFSYNTNPAAKTDRVGKIRPIIKHFREHSRMGFCLEKSCLSTKGCFRLSPSSMGRE
jgi:hypothetical protein